MATVKEQLDAMRGLTENWDGYGAAAPQGHVLDLAQEFVVFIETALSKSASATAQLHVSPTRIGGVLIEWEDAAMQHEVEMNPDGTIGFLHLNKATGQIETARFAAA